MASFLSLQPLPSTKTPSLYLTRGATLLCLHPLPSAITPSDLTRVKRTRFLLLRPLYSVLFNSSIFWLPLYLLLLFFLLHILPLPPTLHPFNNPNKSWKLSSFYFVVIPQTLSLISLSNPFPSNFKNYGTCHYLPVLSLDPCVANTTKHNNNNQQWRDHDA